MCTVLLEATSQFIIFAISKILHPTIPPCIDCGAVLPHHQTIFFVRAPICLLDMRILCAFVASSHSIPSWRSFAFVASCKLPSPFANMLDSRIFCAFVASSHSIPSWRSFLFAASWNLPSPFANMLDRRIFCAFVASSH